MIIPPPLQPTRRYGIKAVLRDVARCLVLLHLPIYSPWLNPIEML